MANMPTEEVSPPQIVAALMVMFLVQKPLSYAGTIISGMKFTFKMEKLLTFS